MAVAAVAALAIPGCAQEGLRARNWSLQIGSEVWADYQAYVQHGGGLGPDRQGAFAVVVAGSLGLAGFYSYRYCPRQYDGCRPGGPTAISDVLDTCRTENLDCLIFARNEDIQVLYEIVG